MCKSVEFNEYELNNLKGIGDRLFNDTEDPRSCYYNRQMNRPYISWKKISVYTLAPIVASKIFILGLKKLGKYTCLEKYVIISLNILYVLFNLKKICICVIHIYQRYAPESVRKKCRFEPSCSEYMILSIEKYGLIKGVRKGVGRLKRCNINNGGIDLP